MENSGSDFAEKNAISHEEGGGPEDGGGDFIEVSPSELFYISTESLDKLTDHVANGGHILDFCKTMGLRWSDVRKWVNADPERMRAMADAKQAQIEYKREQCFRELDRISHFDLRSIFDAQGKLMSPDKWSEEAGAVVSGYEEIISQDANGNEVVKRKVKNSSKEKTLDRVAEITKLLGNDDKEEQSDLLDVLKRMAHKRQEKLGRSPGQLGPAASPVIDVVATKVAEEEKV